MLTARHGTIALALCPALFADSAQSQQTSPRSRGRVQPPTSQSDQGTQNPTTSQRGTEQSPFVIKTLPTDEEKQKSATDAKREEQKAANDERLARFTENLFWATVALSVIAGFQLFVFGWQGIQLQRTVATAEKEFVATHRPKIRIKHVWLTSDIWQGERIIVNIVFVNNGTLEALLNEAGIRFIVAKDDRSLPPEPHIPSNATPMVAGGKLACGISLKIENVTDGTILTAEQNTVIQQGTAKLYCVGFINYLDGSQRVRTTSYCRVMTFPEASLAH